MFGLAEAASRAAALATVALFGVPLAGERTAKTRLCVTFNGMITGHLGMMPLSYNGDGIYKSIIDGTKAKIKPLPKGLK